MKNTNKILIIDDDKEILSLVSDLLKKHGYKTECAETAEQGLKKLQSKPDLILLDIMLPDGDGVDLCRQIRSQCDIPVIMLTAVDSDIKRILGYEFGACQYITKPFNPDLLVAQIKSVFNIKRTPKKINSRYICFGPWRLDIYERTLFDRDMVTVELSRAEYDLLMLLIENARRVVSRDQITKSMHNRHYDGIDRSVDITIGRLRKKVEQNTAQPRLVKTVHSTGYILTTDVHYTDSLTDDFSSELSEMNHF
ncbi:response regulator transcription factor [Cysteiniphilum sp. 6C5]|uniref:response regulator transcription factor n=1 Tax=unclassified Cysteiniphilum TaxID=2610889 RepID=UPI003F85EFFA